MTAWKYKRIMPEVLVAKLRLIEPKDIVNLAGRNLHDVHSILEKTLYQAEISEITVKQLNSISLENAFLKNFVRTCKEMMEHSPKSISFLLSKILMKFEADSVKAVLRAKRAGLSVDEAMKHIMPVGRLDEARCRKALEISKNVIDVVESLRDLEYGLVLKEALVMYQETGVFFLLEVVLDKYVYGEIWRAAGKLRGLDKKIARTVLGIEIDSTNIKAILRCRAMGIREDQTRRYMMPVSEVFGEKELTNAIRAKDTKSSIKSLLAEARLAMARDYKYILTDLLTGYEASPSLSRLEMILDRGLLKTSLRMLKRYTPFFNIGLILAFLNLKWFEVKNLRAIVRGAEGEISLDKIRKMLILLR